VVGVSDVGLLGAEDESDDLELAVFCVQIE